MSLLVDFEISYEILNKNIIINPFDEKLINPASLDVRLGGVFSKVFPSVSGIIDPSDPDTFSHTTYYADRWDLFPDEFVLATLVEKITLPQNISAELVGKSSLGRLGLDNSSFSGWIDSGFTGSLTLELKNLSKNKIRLTKGMRIGQILFYKHSPCALNYSERKTSKYINQGPAQGSRGV